MDIDTYVDKAIKAFPNQAGKKGYLEKEQFRNIVRNDLTHFLTGTAYDKTVDELMKQVDTNKDGKIDKNEYMRLIKWIATTVRDIRATKKAP